LKALITGGAGFIGSTLAESLIEKGHEVTVLDNLSTGRLENLDPISPHPRVRIVRGTVLDQPLVHQLVQDAQWVFHLAASVGVRLIVEDPLGALMTNTKGSEIVLESVARFRRKVLITSSSEIYGKNANGPLREDDDRILGSPWKTRWIYSTSKAVAEILAQIYWKERKIPF